MKLPIYSYRELIGYASSIKQAERVIKKLITIDKRMTLNVWIRTDIITEIYDLPKGYVYSVSY